MRWEALVAGGRGVPAATHATSEQKEDSILATVFVVRTVEDDVF